MNPTGHHGRTLVNIQSTPMLDHLTFEGVSPGFDTPRTPLPQGSGLKGGDALEFGACHLETQLFFRQPSSILPKPWALKPYILLLESLEIVTSFAGGMRKK